MTNQVTTYLKYANLQMAAEALFELQSATPGKTFSGTIPEKYLTDGNGRSSKFTKTQAIEFVKDWTVVEHISNTTTGFSGTLFRYTGETDEARGLVKDELVMSMRSTEFIDDAVRDSKTNELEIQAFGWAFGQIADMMAWYDKLDATLTRGKSITVTGYSLGGHLATAFNTVMVERKQGWRIDNTYTFNGAGIGVVKDGHSLTQALDEFNAAKGDGANLSYFTDSVAKQLYLDAKVLLDANGPTAAQISTVKGWIQAAFPLAAIPATAQSDPHLRELNLLQDAINRVDDVNKEAERVAAGISSGGSGASALPTPKQNIAQIQLDYQLAVGRAAQYTSGYYSGVVPGAIKAINPDRALRSLQGASPLHDIYAAPLPSAVANSQIHIGTSHAIYIEDQPLKRGSYVGDVVTNSNLLRGETRLLNNGFSKSDFGDTHSLVLLVDSLSVQSVLGKLDPDANSKSLNNLLQNASNKWRITDADQGQAEADVLENVVNGLGKMLISGWTDLKANPSGGTWAVVPDSGSYAGRETFHQKLAEIDKAVTDRGMAGKVKVSLSGVDNGGLARDDFGALLSLQNLSPVLLTAKNPSDRMWLADKLKADNGDAYTAWKADKDMKPEDIAAGKQTFTDAYLRSRAEMLDWKVRFNEKNVAYDTTFGSMLTGRNLYDPITFKAAPLPFITRDLEYKDLEAKLTLNIDGTSSDKRHITFGAAAADALTGGSFNDSLYGGKGDDTLKGQGGKDYLEGNEGADTLQGGMGEDQLVGGVGDDKLDGEDDSDTLMGGDGADSLNGGKGHDVLRGGEGADTYTFNDGFGVDVIDDSDGKGYIDVDGVGQITGSGAKKIAEGVWQTEDKKQTFVEVKDGVNGDGSPRSSLHVLFSDGGTAPVYKPDSLILRNWSKSKNVGITLDDTETPPVTTNSLVGDFQKKNHPTVAGYYEYDGSGNYVSAGPSPNAQDMLTGTLQADKIEGLGGNDALAGAGGADVIEGGNGDDFLLGGSGADMLNGGEGNDFIFGSGVGSLQPKTEISSPQLTADGTELARGYNWVVYKETGIDANGYYPIYYKGADIRSMLNDGSNVIDGGAGTDRISAGSGDDLVHGGDDADTVAGLDGDDWLYGDKGDDVIWGDGLHLDGYLLTVHGDKHGDDVLSGGEGKDNLMGQGGDDSLYGGADEDILFGDDHDEQATPYAVHGNDYLDGGLSSDSLYGGGKDDTLLGGDGDDLLRGDGPKDKLPYEYHGSDELQGGKGNDDLIGGGRADRLDGGEGDDVMYGDESVAGMKAADSGIDTLIGGQGNDTLSGGGKGDTLMGGEGNDALVGDGQYAESGDEGNDFLDGGLGNDTLNGDKGDDSLLGGAGGDLLDGGEGNDVLQGGEGIDVLNGGDGDDFLDGGAGADYLAGGAGNYTYVFDASDTLSDTQFTPGSGTTPGTSMVDAVDDNEGSNTIIFDAGSANNLQVVKTTGANLAVTVNGTSGLVLVNGAAGANNTIQLGSGETLTTQELIGQYAVAGSGVFAASGGAGGNQEFAMAGRGDDEVITTKDKATLSGGRGDDVLHGKGAANTYLYAAGDGDDVIKDGSVISGALGPLGASTISFGKGITAADIWLSAEDLGGGTSGSGTAVPLLGRNLVVNIGSATSASTLTAGRIAQAVNDSWFVAPSKERQAA